MVHGTLLQQSLESEEMKRTMGDFFVCILYSPSSSVLWQCWSSGWQEGVVTKPAPVNCSLLQDPVQCAISPKEKNYEKAVCAYTSEWWKVDTTDQIIHDPYVRMQLWTDSSCQTNTDYNAYTLTCHLTLLSCSTLSYQSWDKIWEFCVNC